MRLPVDIEDFSAGYELANEHGVHLALADPVVFCAPAYKELRKSKPGGSIHGGEYVSIMGPSGSGKSSLVKAGLLPALRSGALPGSDEWVRFEAGSGFVVDANETFQLKVEVDTAYLCTYE